MLDKLNWFMRDWRLNEPTKMDPRLFDIVWEVYRESGSREPVDVLSGYRSPQTNAMLRRRSSQVAEHSQHMAGRAIDAHFVDVGPARIRDIAMRMEEGGVGFYPTGVTWVHIDSGSVRYWPRMSRNALARLFPDGKTVFIPADGQPMPGYELAKAEIEARGGQIQTASGGGLFAWLFGSRGGGSDDAEESGGQEAVVAAGGRGGGRSGGGGVQIADAGPAAIARAKADLPTGPAYASAPEPAPPKPAPVSKPETAPKPEAAPAPQPDVVAALEQPQVESDAQPDSPVTLHGPLAALYLAPLPPRRPSDRDLLLASIANIPLPPIRPTDLAMAASPETIAFSGPLPPIRPAGADPAPQTTASIGPLPPARPSVLRIPVAPPASGGAKAPLSDSGANFGQLPKVITAGVSAPPTRALALAELPPAPAYDGNALLQRAAELTAPLPPMPIPASAQPTASPVPPPGSHSAWTGSVSRLWSALSSISFRSAPAVPDPGLRGTQQ